MFPLSYEEIISGFEAIYRKNNLEFDLSNIHIIPWHDKSIKVEDRISDNWDKLDCEYGRIVTSTGIYTCPFLANDYRGRCGSTFNDYNKKSPLETSFCNTCIKSKKQLFSIDFSQFE